MGIVYRSGEQNWRWKVKLRLCFSNAVWINIPNVYQMCVIEGDNIVWKRIADQVLRQPWDEVRCIACWMPLILNHEDPYLELNEIKKNFNTTYYSEQRIYIDHDQSDNSGLHSESIHQLWLAR